MRAGCCSAPRIRIIFPAPAPKASAARIRRRITSGPFPCVKSRALKLLDDVGLKDKADILPSKLSGGERQRVAIARALANEPSIILADEPTGSLDSKTSSKILKQLIDLHKDKNVTLIIVTHDMDVAKLADRVIEVLDGEIISAGDDSLIDSKINV
ncbi:MAG: ATP-binding cassette domain-containing protein [Methanobrevibacter sp.]|nr:ATP-binding cassette domain-containing protein [Methanobrevibacter sp.]